MLSIMQIVTKMDIFGVVLYFSSFDEFFSVLILNMLINNYFTITNGFFIGSGHFSFPEHIIVHFNNSKCPCDAAIKDVSASTEHTFFTDNFKIFKCPPNAVFPRI
jgi:hypothetical protein